MNTEDDSEAKTKEPYYTTVEREDPHYSTVEIKRPDASTIELKKNKKNNAYEIPLQLLQKDQC